MTATAGHDVYYNPWDVTLNAGPYPMLQRLRNENKLLGNALARLEGRIAPDEILNRFPDWEVDLDAAVFSSSSAVRGWDILPTRIAN